MFQLASVLTYVLVLSKHSSLEHLSRNFGFWNGLPYLIQPQTAATMSVSSMSDLDNEAVPKKTSFGDAASKMGGGNINSVAMITKSLVKVCTDCLTKASTLINKALPFYGFKMILTVQTILVVYQSFYTGPICFNRVQIILDRSKL